MGKTAQVPYKDIAAGMVDVIGLPTFHSDRKCPTTSTKLLKLGHYGRGDLNEIIKAAPKLIFQFHDR